MSCRIENGRAILPNGKDSKLLAKLREVVNNNFKAEALYESIYNSEGEFKKFSMGRRLGLRNYKVLDFTKDEDGKEIQRWGKKDYIKRKVAINKLINGVLHPDVRTLLVLNVDFNQVFKKLIQRHEKKGWQ